VKFNKEGWKIEGPARLSGLTIGFGAYIVISALFMLQVTRWLFATFGEVFAADCLKWFSFLLFMSAALYAFKRRISLPKALILFSVFSLGYLLAARQRFLAEKTHILMYGLLGYMASSDLAGEKDISLPKNTLFALAFVTLISGLDETLQFILPYRVGELKDFMTNVLSGMLGMALFFSLRKE
jgi:VanZ family protein